MIKFLRALYVLLLAGFVIMFVTFGIIAFYPGTEAPEYPKIEPPRPVLLPDKGPESPEYQQFQEEQRKAQQEYEQRRQAWEEEDQRYRRSIFFIAFPLAVLIIGLGLWLPSRLEVFRMGLALGGAGLVLYGVVQYGEAAGDVARFVTAAAGLAFLLYLGYRQLVSKRAAEP